MTETSAAAVTPLCSYSVYTPKGENQRSEQTLTRTFISRKQKFHIKICLLFIPSYRVFMVHWSEKLYLSRLYCAHIFYGHLGGDFYVSIS